MKWMTCLLLLTIAVNAIALEMGSSWEPAQVVAPWPSTSEPPVRLNNEYFLFFAREIWKSSNGQDWELVLKNPPWAPLTAYASASFDNSLYVLGGRRDGRLAEVWASLDGIDWELVTQSPGWTPRSSADAFEYDGKLWLIGGIDEVKRNDLWVTEDGATWTEVANELPFSPRTNFSLTRVNDTFLLCGGSDTDVLNEVWSSTDAVNWTLVEDAAPWSPRHSHFAVTDGNRLFLLAGSAGGDGGTYFNDVWTTVNGVDWSLLTGAADWTPRIPQSAAYIEQQLWVYGAHVDIRKDIWKSSDGVTWEEVTQTPEFGELSTFPAIVYQEHIWLFGGERNGERTNDIWSSPTGWEWTNVNPDPAWTPRRGHAVVEHQGALYLLGGHTAEGHANEVWTSANGVDWGLIEASAPWSPRSFHGAASFNGKLWLIAGGGVGTSLKDVWNSVDGVEWERVVADAPWERRRGVNVAVHRNRLWLAGGELGIEGSHHDIWSTADGINWIEHDLTLPFTPARQNAGFFSHGGRLWYMGGYCCPVVENDGIQDPVLTSLYLNDVWSSFDGERWSQVTPEAAWGPRRAFGALAFQEKLWVIGGSAHGTYRDVWLSEGDLSEHSADANGDFRLDLSELLRQIQLYQAGAYHCDPESEDGYAPGPGDTAACAPHQGDYDPRDWSINLFELLRAIQVYNSNGYGLCPEGEDGLCLW